MITLEILLRAREAGVLLSAVGSRLRGRCRGALPDDLRRLLLAHKGEILAALRPEAEPPSARPWRCWWCKGTRAWRSRWVQRRCARCSPPAQPGLVLEWIGGEGT